MCSTACPRVVGELLRCSPWCQGSQGHLPSLPRIVDGSIGLGPFDGSFFCNGEVLVPGFPEVLSGKQALIEDNEGFQVYVSWGGCLFGEHLMLGPVACLDVAVSMLCANLALAAVGLVSLVPSFMVVK